MERRKPLEITSNSPEETKQFGRVLAKYLKPGDLVLFYGDLGSGKTTLIQGICEGLEVDPEIYVTSPTFAIVNLYEGKYPVFHVDLYRIEEDLYELGIWENLSTSIILIEWAEKLPEIPKPDYLEIKLDYLDEFQKRKIILIGYGEWSGLLRELERDEELNK